MSLTETIIVFGGVTLTVALLWLCWPLILAQLGNPMLWLGFLKSLLTTIIPILAKRGTPEQEAEAQRQYRQGGDGNIPLPADRPGRRKWLFGKGGLFGARDEKATTPKNQG